MTDFSTTGRPNPQRIGIAADNGGFELEQHLVEMLRET